MKNILITGAKGFIGRNLVKELSSKYNVTGISREDVDLLDYKAVDKFFSNKIKGYYDTIIHCAVKGGRRTIQDPESIVYENTLMAQNILENDLDYHYFINLGSGAETHQINSPYGLSKRLIKHMLKNSLVKYFNLKLFGIFGADESDDRFIKASILNYINKQPIIIFNDIYMTYLYIKDLSKMIETLIEVKPRGHSDGCYPYQNFVKLSQIANIINDLSDYKVEIHIKNKDNFAQSYAGGNYDLPLINNGYIGLEKGIKEMYNEINQKMNK